MLARPPNSCFTRLSPDILKHILYYLDPYALASFSETCRLFHNTVRWELNFDIAVCHQRSLRAMAAATVTHGRDSVVPSRHSLPRLAIEPLCQNASSSSPPPPVFHLRCLAKIGRRLYMPFMTMKPVCYVYDIDQNTWTHYPLQRYPGYTSFVAPVVAIGTRLYMFGGRKIAAATLSDEVHVIDIETWAFKRLQLMRGPLPTPRCDHTVDVLQNRYLLVFGGVCSNSLGENDLIVFDTKTNTWTEPETTGQIPSVGYGHASAVIDTNLYIFGGCDTHAEDYLVQDTLYRLDCNSWTWHKFDRPEAYSYRRSHRFSPSADGHSPSSSTQQQQVHHSALAVKAMVDSLRRDLIIETTGHSPRDRFHCILQPVGRYKLLVFGGHTVRQDSDDYNVLHAHSLSSIDVFDLKRNHWSASTTSTQDSDENGIYPQDASAFLMENHHLLVIGQQKIFSASTDLSEDEWSDDFCDPLTVSSKDVKIYYTDQDRLCTHHSALSPVENVKHLPYARRQSTPRMRHTSRPIADYDGFLDSMSTSDDEGKSYYNYPPVDGMTPSPPNNARDSSLDTMRYTYHLQEHDSRQYTLEPLCIVLKLNQA